MDALSLFNNMKRWLLTQENSLTDLLFPLTDPSKRVPFERHEGIAAVFDKHFNLLSFYTSQVGAGFPLIAVSFEDTSEDDCFCEWEIVFNTYFDTVEVKDVCSTEVAVANTPEKILAFKQAVECGLREMMCLMGDELRGAVFDDGVWRYPLNYDVIRVDFQDFDTSFGDEILHFRSRFVVSDNVSSC